MPSRTPSDYTSDPTVSPERLVVDASFLVAIVDSSDSLHGRARSLDASLEASPYEVLYFDILVAEAISALARRSRERKRTHEFGPALDALLGRSEDNLLWIAQFLPNTFYEVIDLVRQSEGRLNFNDAFIALVMREQGLRYLLSFDADFDTLPWLTRIGSVESLEALRPSSDGRP